jgi:N-acetylglucosaminyldiphosphoundecaprenol N-acetyl-beta-D-mannosaminyltransferase
MTGIESRRILGMNVDATNYERTSSAVVEWSQRGQSRYICVATVNNAMESFDNPEFRRVMNQADLVTPDGMPLVWGLRLLGVSHASRTYGPDLTPVVLKAAEALGIGVGFFGASQAVLEALLIEVRQRFPRVRISYAYSPPFRQLTSAEDRRVVDDVNRSGCRILFVGLSTPKQEYWMAAHRPGVQAVMLGVGAAFDFLAGTKPQAPRWMMRIGLEWLFRLATEPRRLWRRYLKHNPRFVFLFALQLLGWDVCKFASRTGSA